jgi:hypothetical protein
LSEDDGVITCDFIQNDEVNEQMETHIEKHTLKSADVGKLAAAIQGLKLQDSVLFESLPTPLSWFPQALDEDSGTA